MEQKYKTFATQIIKADGENRSMRFLISTDSVDRDDDVLDPKGWELERYKTNPVVMFAHDYKSLPVAKCIDIHQTSKGLEAVAEFPPAGTYQFADTVYDMLKAGFLNSTSVGFRPIDFEQAKDRKGYNFRKQELTEFSIVPIPSNPDALVQQRSATSEQVGIWCKAVTEWAAAKALTPAQQAVKQLLSTKEPWATDAKAWADLEKDYAIEAEAGELSPERLDKLLALHGFMGTPSAKAAETMAAKALSAQRHIMDAYANAHHAESVMSELCGAPANNAQGKALSGEHASRAREAHGAIGRAKGHAMAAAECIGKNESDEDMEKALKDAAEQGHGDIVLKLLDGDDNPNTIVLKDDVMRDAMTSLGPELATMIAGHTRDTINKMLGRID